MENIERRHFNSIADQYHQTAPSREMLYSQTRSLINPIVNGKIVLDVGSGGCFVFDPGLTQKTICLDISQSMLDQIKDERVEKRVSDARSLDGIGDKSIDAIVFNYSLHHINGKNVKESIEGLGNILDTCRRKLVPQGKLIIGEPVFNRFLFGVESLLFPVTKWFLSQFDISMIFQFSQSLLVQEITQHLHCKKEDIKIHELKLEKSFDPLGGSFPGLIKIPGWLYPARFLVFIASKPID